MKNKLIVKGLVLWAILICVVINIVSADASIIKKPITSQINNTEDTNLLCNITVIWHRFGLKPTVIVTPGKTIFNFTEIGGYVKANFTIICKTWSDPTVYLPRWSVFVPGIYKTHTEPDHTGMYAFFYQHGTEEFKIVWYDLLMPTNGENISRLVWCAGGGLISQQYVDDWDITICPK
jgi:hypothetical protein